MKQHITECPGGPPCSGPYSLGVIAEGKFLFVSGQGPWDPATGKFDRSSISEQTRLTLDNVGRIVALAGGKMEDVVSCRVFLQPLNAGTFAEMNDVYARYWTAGNPARTTVGAQLLNIDVEIDCIVRLR